MYFNENIAMSSFEISARRECGNIGLLTQRARSDKYIYALNARMKSRAFVFFARLA